MRIDPLIRSFEVPSVLPFKFSDGMSCIPAAAASSGGRSGSYS